MTDTTTTQPRPKIAELKIKVVSLGDEARRIRKEEVTERTKMRSCLRHKPADLPHAAEHSVTRERLYHHRLGLRYKARYAQLAYAMLRGVPYRVAENKTKPGNEPSAWCLADDVNTFGGCDSKESGVVAAANWLTVAPIDPTPHGVEDCKAKFDNAGQFTGKPVIG
jgi:hypothetical protein